MKAKFDDKGILHVDPSTLAEDKKLREWYQKNKEGVVSQSIVFGRKRS